MVGTCLSFNCYVKSMRWMIMREWCGSWVVNDGFGMILTCDLNEKVDIKVTWYWYEMKFYIHGLRMMSWYGFTWNMKKVDYKGLAWDIYIYMHDKSFLIDWVWLVCGQYVNPWASRWDLMVVLQWSGRKSMTPVSGSSWWCPIYIIW